MVAHAETGNLYEMMEHLGIRQCEGALSKVSSRFGVALRRCEACRCKKDCREWLDHAPAAANCAPGFCKNAEILLELQCGRAR